MGQVSGWANTAATGAYKTGLVVGALLLVAVVVGLIVWIMIHNRLVRINYTTKHGTELVLDDKARLVKKKGAYYWSLLRLRKKWLAPPSEAVGLTRKAKFCAECYYREGDDHPHWLIRKGPEATAEFFAPEDKALLVEQLEEAEARKSSLLQTITQLAVPLTFLLVVILVLVFWNDIWKPMKESQQHMAVITTENAKIAEQNARILAVMYGRLDIKNLTVTQTVSGPTPFPADIAG